MIHGDEKQRTMARSVLPARAHTRKAARLDKRRVHHTVRAEERAALATILYDDDFDERPLAEDAQTRAAGGGLRVVVRRRRYSDKLGPLIRWANANADDLGPDPASRCAALRAMLPQGLIGDHAMSHIQHEPAFRVESESRWWARRGPDLDRPRNLQSLRDRLIHRLLRSADRYGELNQQLKDAWVPIPDRPDRRPRLLLGAHDVDDFVEAYMVGIIEPRWCSRCRNYHGEPAKDIVLRFCDIDPDDPFARRTFDGDGPILGAVTTHEREITEPVDLCTPDGRRLNPAAKGWSRQPIVTANLRGTWGRNKKWDYWAILAGDLAIAVTYADVDYLGMASIWWADLATGVTGGADHNLPGARGVTLPDLPGTRPLRWSGRTAVLDLVDDDDGTTIEAQWVERGGTEAKLHARIDLPAGHESLNVVIPWSDTRFQFTSKHQARPASGTLTVGADVRTFGRDDEAGADAWGVLDVGRGRWPYRNVWNWAGGAGRAAGSSDGAEHVVGLQFGGKWTEGTGFTENGLIIDGRLSKIGDELRWDYDWDRPMQPWSVRSPDGSVDVVLHPRYDRHSKVEAVVMGMEVHQVFGHWSGTVRDDDGVTYRFEQLQGFAEEARNRW